jgi:LacI family transcriptional regulator
MVGPESTKRPTMGDVAKLAGVSRKTVSRVYNSEPTVAEELVAKVRIAADQLNYKMNLVASDLRRSGGRPSTIGLLIQDVSNEFSASIFRSVEDVAEQFGVTVLASNLDESAERERELTSILIARRVDGLLIVPAGLDQSYLANEQRSGMPFVFLDRPPHLVLADTVLSDNENGSFNGVTHLIEHGHRRIAFIGETGTNEPARQRFDGYRVALQHATIPVDSNIIRQDLQSETDAERAIIEIMATNSPPTAVFSAHNRLTKGVVKGLRTMGVERTVALVGFDDFELAYLLQPAVTVVAQDPATIGRVGAEKLFKRIHGDHSPVGTQIVPTTLIPRGSGEISAPRRPSSVAR